MIANPINNTKEDGKLKAYSSIEVILALVDRSIVADKESVRALMPNMV
jgi:hypothetical protein